MKFIKEFTRFLIGFQFGRYKDINELIEIVENSDFEMLKEQVISELEKMKKKEFHE